MNVHWKATLRSTAEISQPLFFTVNLKVNISYLVTEWRDFCFQTENSLRKFMKVSQLCFAKTTRILLPWDLHFKPYCNWMLTTSAKNVSQLRITKRCNVFWQLWKSSSRHKVYCTVIMMPIKSIYHFSVLVSLFAGKSKEWEGFRKCSKNGAMSKDWKIITDCYKSDNIWHFEQNIMVN